MQEESPILFKTLNGEWKTAKCDECLSKHLGDRVDLEWNIKTGCLKIERTQCNKESPIIY